MNLQAIIKENHFKKVFHTFLIRFYICFYIFLYIYFLIAFSLNFCTRIEIGQVHS